MERSTNEPLSFEPLFIARATEIAAVDHVLRLLPRAICRQTALLGPRRIGKTLLLDEVRLHYPTVAIARLDVGAIVTSPEHLAWASIPEALGAVLRARAEHYHIAQTDHGMPAVAGNLNTDLEVLKFQHKNQATEERP